MLSKMLGYEFNDNAKERNFDFLGSQIRLRPNFIILFSLIDLCHDKDSLCNICPYDLPIRGEPD